MYNWDSVKVRRELLALMELDAVTQLSFPFETMEGPAGLFETAYSPMVAAFPDVERRDFIVAAGDDSEGNQWVGCAGHYTGTFTNPFLGIPPTRRSASFRFHEFYRFVEGRVVETQAVWDLPELMIQAGLWPMARSLGREWQVPGPAPQDGIRTGPRDGAVSGRSVDHVVGMLRDMGRHPAAPAEAMNLEKWWHPRFSWYGPAGIGSMRGMDGFRQHHQRPFLDAMPDRAGGYRGDGHFFADGPYAGVTAWPGMTATITGSGWLGIPASGQAITIRSLDFWRLEFGRIRENWVLVDLLDVYHQLGVDVFARMTELL